jgi:IS605 OrfB family transposase
MTQKAFRYRFYPTPEPANLLRRTLGRTRLVYNRALTARTEGWHQRQERIGYKETSAMLAEWKKEDELSFLNEVSCVPLQQGLRHLQTAFSHFWAGRDRAQKALFRKMNDANNRHKPRLKVAKLQAEIADPRKDFFHKLTTQLVRDNQTIAIEDLAVKNMLKNRNLAQSIWDASWGELVRQLTYKSEWYGRELVKIDRWFPSSKRCSNCGQVVERLPLNVREWECPECGHEHDWDVNAAINVLAAGQALSVWVATVRPEESQSRRAGATKQKLRS